MPFEVGSTTTSAISGIVSRPSPMTLWDCGNDTHFTLSLGSWLRGQEVQKAASSPGRLIRQPNRRHRQHRHGGQAEFVASNKSPRASSIRRRAADSSVLDVGCGLGRVALGLVDLFAKSGSYVGLDIVPSSISWCKSAFADHPNFGFVHADVFSKFYNPLGSQSAEKYKFPFADGSFDFVFSMSLFTHLMIEASDIYLGEIGRVAKPGARVVNTFCILDEISAPLVGGFHEVPGGAVQNLDAPEFVSALNLEPLKEIHRKHGLEIEGLGFGFWSGRPDGNPGSYQDCIVARKSK